MAQSRAIEQIIRTRAASGDGYESTNLNPEKGLISSTFGPIVRNSIEAAFDGVGLDQNVSAGFANAMSDPSNGIEVRGRTFFGISPIGFNKPYNSYGDSALGFNSFYTIC